MEKRVKELEEQVNALTQAFADLRNKVNLKLDKEQLLISDKIKELHNSNDSLVIGKIEDLPTSVLKKLI